jgi:putative SOS response-associated peptidase YedK
MCGRYALHGPFNRRDPDWVARWMEQLVTVTGGTSRYNIAPGTEVPVFLAVDGEPAARMLRWGLVPSWSKDPKIAYHTINARSETVAEKPAFRGAWRAGQRCIVPASGWYEWQARDGGKQPWFISAADEGNPLGFAGLWDHWRTPDGTILLSCTILTVPAAESIAALHDRQPLVLDPADWPVWLAARPATVADLLRTPAMGWRSWPVSKAVGNARHEGPDLLRPVA